MSRIYRLPAWPLAKALADKGHNVTFISPYYEEGSDNKEFLGNFLLLPIVHTIGLTVCEKIYEDAEFVNFVKSSKFDIVILHALMNDCGYGVAYYWGAKVILFDTTAPFDHFPEAHGTPDETSWIPSTLYAYPLKMSFFQRIRNALLPIVLHYNRQTNFFPFLETITRNSLGIRDLPEFEELERNTSLVFTNSHYGEEFARSLPPNVIPIGGITYSEQRKPLPKEMSAFLDKGEGFIYLNFGLSANYIRSLKNVHKVFIEAMQTMAPVQFLWKIDDPSLMKEFPLNNVFISKWMPQQDILEFARSLPPNVIPIGGITYSEQRNPLPKEISAFLDKGEGFIYLNFGLSTNYMRSLKNVHKVFIEAMQTMATVQFLWKDDDPSLMKEFPLNNVFISKWMPQQDILAHPKIQAFITIGELMDIHEAIYNSVPLISFPLFAEQMYNAERIHRREYGIQLDKSMFSRTELVKAIIKVLSSDKYRKNMERVSVMFRDRPQKPLDTALWWTEFVIRHSPEDLATLRPLSA
ncbi:UDP-glucuronosyltransferase 1A7 [Pseudolycoriella hygida]|uniref:UDP-glucuronosyltransferase 1A7 n=1 Tax=Pseudolycoriella hygida TaxID=35572 RepID=A0A9Q0S343_9DIPT|nr:UDP-glucuronosyltransferase 1A7 [Pseudolycoriella hygida]